MRTFMPAAFLAVLVLPLTGSTFAAFAADLDYVPEPPPPVLYERPLPPPVYYPRPVIYPRPVVRVFPRPYPLYYPRPVVRVFPRPAERFYGPPIVRYEPRPDAYPRPYAREDDGRHFSREAEEYRRPREDFGRPREDFGRPRDDFGRPRDDFERRERPGYSRAAPFERDEHYADRRGERGFPRGDYDR